MVELAYGQTHKDRVEKEQDILLDHNYDGIRELDNHLPPWWTWLFNLTIVFAVVYLLIYHVFQVAPLQTEQYDAEITEAREAAQARQAALVASGDAFDESTIEFRRVFYLAYSEGCTVQVCADPLPLQFQKEKKLQPI